MKIGMLPLRVRDDIKLVPSGLMYIASYLEKYSNFNDIYMRLDARNLIEQKPDVVAIGSVTQTFTEATQIAKEIKQYLPATKIIVGGPHISAMPDTLPRYFDAGVLGEGEQTMLELLKVIEANEFNSEKLQAVDGLVFHDEQGNHVVNRRREWIDNLDYIPPPKREFIGNLEEKLHQTLLTARGCSFKCKYCASTQFWEKIRFHSAERVVEEIVHIIDNYPKQKNITINDDLFTANVKRLRVMVELIREAGIHKKVSFVCNSRASVFSEEICELLLKMNVNYIIFGLESGSNKILSYLKGSTKAIKNHQAVNICRKLGIASHGNFIFGSPIEDKFDAAQSYWFARSMKDMAMTFSIAPATPFPGTSFWQYVTEKKIIDKETFDEWHEFSLDWNPDRFYFMNENYSKQEFIEMMNELMLLKVDKNIVDTSVKFSNYKSRLNYYKLIYDKLFENINQNDDIKNILEISVVKPAGESDIPLREDINRVKTGVVAGYCDYETAINNSGIEEFDTVIFMHSLEFIKNASELIAEVSALKGVKRIIAVSYNVKHISMLIDLMAGEWITYKTGIDNEARFNHYDVKNLSHLLENNGFKIVDTDKNLSKVDQYADTYKTLIQLFGKMTNIKDYIFESDSASFILTAEKI